MRLLICTDVAARGLDIAGLPLVVNLTLPDADENYVHRIGRVGRAEVGAAMRERSLHRPYMTTYIVSHRPRRPRRGGRGDERETTYIVSHRPRRPRRGAVLSSRTRRRGKPPRTLRVARRVIHGRATVAHAGVGRSQEGAMCRPCRGPRRPRAPHNRAPHTKRCL